MPEAPATNKPYPHGALPIGTRLGEFEIRRVLGVGGFGIVYLAFDHLLEREVALKEYMPSTLVDRNETMHVSLISQANADTFALGLRSFVNEARLLARFDHPSLVKVHRFWEANGTAYMAMALYKGRTVRDVRNEMKVRPDEAWVRQILEPLLGAIERLHSEDVFHRDIAPDNILLEADGRPVLLDFGAARRVITDRSQALTAILKPSYAPIEQYADTGGMKQGAWTDIYALGATMHFLLMGRPPPPAPGRSIQDTMPPLASQDLAGCSKPFLELIDWMLSPMPAERPQSVAQVRDALAGRISPPHKLPVSPMERTVPMEGPGGMPPLARADEATVVVPRGQTAMPPPPSHQGDEATVIVPRNAQTGYNSQLRMAPPPPPPPPVAAPQVPPPQRPPVDDEDATVVTAYPAGFQTQRPPAAPPQVQMPPMTTVAPPAPPRAPAPAPRPAAAAQPASSKGWLGPVVGGVAVAVLIGGGLWWFLTRPVSTDLPPPPPPASAALPAPEPTPAPAPEPVRPVEPPASAAVVPPTVQPPVAQPEPTPAPVTRPAVAPSKPVAPKPAEPVARKPEPTVRPAPQVTPAPPPVTPAPVPAVVTPPAGSDPGKAASAADDGRARSPSERCAKELPLVRLICIDLACNRDEFKKHPECVKLRADQAQKRYLEGN